MKNVFWKNTLVILSAAAAGVIFLIQPRSDQISTEYVDDGGLDHPTLCFVPAEEEYTSDCYDSICTLAVDLELEDTSSCCCIEEVCQVASTLFIGYRGPHGVGYDDGYTTVGFMYFPSICSTELWPFLDLRAHYITNNEWAANAGIGFRYAPACSGSVLGINAYFDYRTDHHRDFHFTQGAVGFEYLNGCFDFRVNGYFPIHGCKRIDNCRFFYPAGYFVSQDVSRCALLGFDGEVGVFLNDRVCRYNGYFAIGGYYYGGNVCRNLGGVRARYQFRICNNIRLEALVTHDCVFGTRAQGALTFYFPFCGDPPCGCKQDILSQPVYRNELIALDDNCKWDWNFDDDGCICGCGGSCGCN